MNVNNWGPGGWIFLHSMAANYPNNPTDFDKQRYSQFFNSVGNMLPCRYCRESYKTYMKYLPIESFLNDREGVHYWLYRLHNLINDKIFKQTTSFRNVVSTYENIRATCGKKQRDDDYQKNYNTCQTQNGNLQDAYILDFVNSAEQKYKQLVDDMVNNLYSSSDNPNKDYLEYQKKNGIQMSYNIDYL